MITAEIFESPLQATSKEQSLLNRCVVSEHTVADILEKQILGVLELGSATLTMIADPARDGLVKLLIQASSGHSAVFPADISVMTL